VNWRRIGIFSACFAVLATVVAFATGYRTFNLYNNAKDLQEEVKYLIETGGTIGQTPADSALSSTYLEIIFGDNPELLEQLQNAVDRGSEAMPDVRKGEVSSIIITYRKNGDEKITNVVAHIMGGFPLGKRKISMHRHGFFASQVDRQIWATGDSTLKFLGRDMVVWANNAEDEQAQNKLLEAVFSGEVIDLAADISEKTLYYTAVFPSPRQIVPAKMRQHIKAILVEGSLSPDRGTIKVVILTNGKRSTALVNTMAQDLKTGLQIALRTRFKGVMRDTAWGPHVPVWWAYEMANTLDQVELTRRDLTVSLSTVYERRMVNASLKTIERFGRDFSQIKGIKDDKLSPRQVDAMLRTAKPVHYWSEAHQWGPDWPFGSGTNVFVRRPSEEPESLEDAPPATQPL